MFACWLRSGMLAGVIALVAGCQQSDDRPRVVKASGTVQYQNGPVVGAHVSFLGSGESPPAYATTGADGRFQLTTFEDGDGVVPGTYVVTIAKMESTSVEPSGVFDPVADMEAQAKEAQSPKKQAIPRSLVPAKYGSAATSPLKLTVEDGGPNQFPIQLTD